MQEFNFFKILEKDNKELIHSAFIAYLIDSDKNFVMQFLGIDKALENSQLEMAYTAKKKRKNEKSKARIRIDIQVKSQDQSIVTFIENKFKSFPTKAQLDHYDRLLAPYFTKHTILNKILVCFDKRLVHFKTDWKVFDYEDLLQYIKLNYDISTGDDKSIFIRHYANFLEEYSNQYKAMPIDCYKLFVKSPTTEQKFWIRLLNSRIAMQFETEFSDEAIGLVINPGNTAIPLLDIIHGNGKRRSEKLY
ncbi:MAG: hypothetical protein EOO20_01970 [Chryseobacterium sp.]|nr:MAG: hypothetical protein EOO20_01970 [Chryseobacterium sp.]